MQYTDIPLIENSLKRDLTADEIAAMSVLIPAVERWIDAKTGTTFKKVDATSRLYEGGEPEIDIEPCTEIEEVVAVQDDGSDSYPYTKNMQWVAYPLNENVKDEIRLRGIQGNFPFGDARVRVKAKFSSFDGEIPADITTVATLVVIDALRIAQAGTTSVKSEDIEGHRIAFQDLDMTFKNIGESNPLVASILGQRRQILL